MSVKKNDKGLTKSVIISRMDVYLWRAFRAKCALRGISMKEKIKAWIRQWLTETNDEEQR